MSFDRRLYGPEENLLSILDRQDSLLARWRRSQVSPVTKNIYAPSAIVYDPVAAAWVLFSWNQTDGLIYQSTSTNYRVFPIPTTLVLGLGSAGAWDDGAIALSGCVWYEAGQTRPWRMLYRGNQAAGIADIGLATSIDRLTWERKDTAGNALSAAVLVHGASGWSDTSLDPGSIIKVGNTYYLYFSTVTITARKIGLATSADLVTWAKDASNPLYIGTVGEDIADATVDDNQGRYCADIVRWDTAAGVTRYVMIVPHYTGVHTLAEAEVYTCPNPQFYQDDRSFVGKLFQTNIAPAEQQMGINITSAGYDNPFIICDDIFRNVTKRQRTGSELAMVNAVSANNWTTEIFIHDRTLSGGLDSDGTLRGCKFVNILSDLPLGNPVFKLAPKGSDNNVRALWLPGQTGTLMDMSGNGIHLPSVTEGIDGNGAKMIAANARRPSRVPSLGNTTDPVATILEVDRTIFSIEAKVTFASSFLSGSRYIYAQAASGTVRHMEFYLASDGTNYTIKFVSRSGAVNKTVTSPNIPIASILLNTPYYISICRDASKKFYPFLNGVSLVPGGGSSTWTSIDDYSAQNPPVPVYLGGYIAASYWDGYIDEVRISNICRNIIDYTPANFTINYQSSGQIFTGVYDALIAKIGNLSLLSAVTPAGTTITIKARNASSLADQSVLTTDFTLDNPTGRYHQYLITLATTDPTVTPSIQGAIPYSYEDGHDLNGAYSDHDLEQIDLEDHWH